MMYFQPVLSSSIALLSANFSVILCLVVVIIFFIQSTKRPRNFPPGPRGFPILGVAPYVEGRFEKSFAKWRKQYGDIMGFRVGSDLTVVLSTYELIFDALVKNSMAFSNRPTNFLMHDVLLKSGILSADYTASYIKERKFASLSLSKLGFGKTSMETVIVSECRNFVNQIADGHFEYNEEVEDMLFNSVGNIICQVFLGQRYEADDLDFVQLVTGLHSFFDNGDLAQRMSYILPWCVHIPPVRGSARATMDGVAAIDGMVVKKVKEHEANLDKSNPLDFIDEYLLEMKAGGNKFSYKKLQCIGRDLFGAAMETTHTSLRYLFILLANRPEVQKQAQEEIDNVLGSEGVPKYAQRDKMLFCQAVLREVLRFKTPAPLAIPHCTSMDVDFHGYHIPKGTTVMPNLYAVHMDPEVWDEPEIFKPERHLDSDGKLINFKQFIPFGIGARSCIGRKLAEVELFMFMVTVLQKFNIVPAPVPGCEHPQVPEESGRTGMTMQAPQDVHFNFVQR